ncbi:MAG: B12-binding domain-containing radical SAM protein [Kiritimatiellia bacterium]
MKPEILLIAVNAGYAHTSMSLRCLLANLGDLEARAAIREFDSRLEPMQIVEAIVAVEPGIAAFSVYIWNVEIMKDVLRLLRAVRPGIVLVAGGPQIVPGDDPAGILPLVDVAVSGEGEGVMHGIFATLLAGGAVASPVVAEPPDLARVALPYRLYSDEDIAHRVVYAEATRGCPFRCEYCTSSGSGGVRAFPREPLLAAFGALLDRGARQFKFLDRSFNFGGEASLAVLDFFAERQSDGLRLHFEFTPDVLDDAWRERLLRFRPGMLHVEMGVQTWNVEVAKSMRRPLDPPKVEEALRFMIEEAKADVHADLIAGLPGEDEASFQAGFDRLVALGPAEIQVGILKRLPGTAIGRHDAAEGVRWSPLPPYEILENRRMPFARLRAIERFGRCWNLLVNSGRFRTSAPMLWRDGGSPYARGMRVMETVFAASGRMHAIGPKRLAAALHDVLVGEAGVPDAEVRAALERDAREAAWDRS